MTFAALLRKLRGQARLTQEELMDAAPGTGGVVSIHAIGGMAGVGKTAFAVRAELAAL